VAELYVVATPIGNLKDITLRALEILQTVDLVAAEDTRTTRKLLTAHGISKPLTSCNSRTEKAAAAKVISALRSGSSVAFTSDAGTPGISDPGKVLVRFTREAGFDVVPIPGASAATALLSVSGHFGKQVLIEGFLSPKSGRRRKRLLELLGYRMPFIVFESPFRVLKLLSDLADLSPERQVFLGREMTKIHEEIMVGMPEDVATRLVGRDSVRGEFSLLVDGGKKN